MARPFGSDEQSGYAISFDKYRSHTQETTIASLQRIQRYAPVGQGTRILDIGCGTGRYALPLASETEAQVFATDVSQAMVHQARQKATAHLVFWSVSDACSLPFSDGSFDTVLLFHVIHLVSDQMKALREAYRVLRAEGHFLISGHSHRQLDRQLMFRFFPEARKLNKKRMPSIAKLKRMVRTVGFRRIQTELFVDATPYSREVYLEKIRGKPNSSLRAMSEAAFWQGYASLQKALVAEAEVVEDIPNTILAAEK